MQQQTFIEENWEDREFEDSVTFYYDHCLFTEPELIVGNYKIFVFDLLKVHLKMTDHKDHVNYTLSVIRKCSSFNNEDFENLSWKLIWGLKELDDPYADIFEEAYIHRDRFEFIDYKDEKSSFFNTPNNLMPLS